MSALLSVPVIKYCLMIVAVIAYLKILNGFKRAWDKIKNTQRI